MLLSRNFGFSCLILEIVFSIVLCLSIYLVVRHKWRLAAKRKEEIRRLLVLAAEEAARIETEVDCSKVHLKTVPLKSNILLSSLCVVCYSPTSTRCARCKGAKYCSGKCQIIHWREGHRYQCHPPSTTINDNLNSPDRKPATEEHKVKSIETTDKPQSSSWVSASENLNRPQSSSCESLESGYTSEDSSDLPSGVSASRKSANISDGNQSDNTTPNLFENSPFRENPSQSEKVFSEPTKVVDSGNRDPFSLGRSRREGSNTSSSSVSDKIDQFDCILSPKIPTVSFASQGQSFCVGKSPEAEVDEIRFSRTKDDDSSNVGGFLQFSFSLSEKSLPLPVRQCSELKQDVARQFEPDIKNDVQAKASSSPSSNDKLCSRVINSGVSDAHVVKLANLSFKSPNTRESYRSCDTTKMAINKAVGSLNNVPNPLPPREIKSFSLGVFDSNNSDRTEKHSLTVESFQRVGVGYDSTVSPPNHQNFKTSVLKVVDQIRSSTSLKHHPSACWNDTLKRSHDKGAFSYELFVRLYSWKKVELLPFGLANCGNSCYANVVLQCLTFTPAITAYLIQRLHSQKCGRREWCFICEFESLILKAKEGKSPVSPIGILSHIGKISENLGVGKEEDAHEFLRYAIDAMQSICVKEVPTNASKSFGEDSTLVNLTFGGYLQSKIKCGKCHGKSERHERMMDLTVEIEGDIRSLEEALRKFTTTEILDGDNKYKCNRCMSHEKAKKKLTILEAPNVLTIVLKRFQSGKFGKLNKLIRFPETLDLAPYMCRTSDKSPIFSLYGVVVHLDIMNASFSGHYVCYVKNVHNKWFKIDDGTVKAVEREGVLTKGAYMLFYARCSPRAVRDVKTTKMSHNNMKRDKTTLVQLPDNGRSNSESSDEYRCEVRGRGIFDPDTSSDSSSLISGSDEGSSTTEGGSDTTSSGDLSEYIFRGDGSAGCDHGRSFFR